MDTQNYLEQLSEWLKCLVKNVYVFFNLLLAVKLKVLISHDQLLTHIVRLSMKQQFQIPVKLVFNRTLRLTTTSIDFFLLLSYIDYNHAGLDIKQFRYVTHECFLYLVDPIF